MDIASILFVIVLVVAVPFGMAWIQARWELRHGRRDAARRKARTEAEAQSDSDC